MQIEQIRTQIEEGKNVEQQTHVLRGAVINLTKLNGVRASELNVETVIGFVTDYIEHAPTLMMMIEDVAAANGVTADVQPILDATEGWFLSVDDIIPDHYGLVGLLDDAYLAYALIEAISDTHTSRFGHSLLPAEAPATNQFIRRLIGEPFVSLLDERVATTLDALSEERDINQIATALAEMNIASVTGPIWGNSSAGEIAGIRLETI